MKTPLDAAALKNRVIGLLARREYSRLELTQRLRQQAVSLSILNDVLDALEQDGYLSDQRCAESFIRQRLSQYWGPKRIRYELQQKGIPASLINRLLEEADPDWDALALSLAAKRFDLSDRADIKEQARRLRYLVNHGFSYDQAQRALKTELM